MAREGLLVDLQATINKAKTEKEGVPVRKEDIQVERNGELKNGNLEVTPFKVASNRERHFLILFEDSRPAGGAELAETMAVERKTFQPRKEKTHGFTTRQLKEEHFADKR